MKEIQINGNNFSTMDGFYDEVESKLTKGLDWKIGRNLDAFSEVLEGGFGIHDYEETIKLEWINSSKSQHDLGYKATINNLKSLLKKCHPSNQESLKKEIELAEIEEGETLFDVILAIIKSNEHIEFYRG